MTDMGFRLILRPGDASPGNPIRNLSMKTSQKRPETLRIRAHTLLVNRAAARHIRGDLLRQALRAGKTKRGPEPFQEEHDQLRPIEIPLEVQEDSSLGSW